MPRQMGSKISVSPRSGISSPKSLTASAASLRSVGASVAPGSAHTYVPEPARRSTSPRPRSSFTARPTVMRDVPKRLIRSASLGSFSPVW